METITPRETMRRAFQAGWLEDEPMWLKLLVDRKATSHTYNETLALEVYEDVRAALPEMRRLYDFLTLRVREF
jgi:nucleotidyltransferase substrate binding protein (TIGR01987 family)